MPSQAKFLPTNHASETTIDLSKRYGDPEQYFGHQKQNQFIAWVFDARVSIPQRFVAGPVDFSFHLILIFLNIYFQKLALYHSNHMILTSLHVGMSIWLYSYGTKKRLIFSFLVAILSALATQVVIGNISL